MPQTVTAQIGLTVHFHASDMQQYETLAPSDIAQIFAHFQGCIRGSKHDEFVDLMASTDWNPVLSTVGSSGHPSLEDLRSSVVDALAAYNAGGFPLTFDTQTPGPPLPIMCVKWELQNGHLVIIYNYAVGVTAAPGDTCFLPPRQALRSLFPQIGNMDIRYHAQISYDLGAA